MTGEEVADEIIDSESSSLVLLLPFFEYFFLLGEMKENFFGVVPFVAHVTFFLW